MMIKRVCCIALYLLSIERHNETTVRVHQLKKSPSQFIKIQPIIFSGSYMREKDTIIFGQNSAISAIVFLTKFGIYSLRWQQWTKIILEGAFLFYRLKLLK